jgi:nicotinate-nucleotide adenylyltransferase
MRTKIAIFGGTFDPIHNGHLRLALELKQHLRLDEMRLMPSHRPPHRDAPSVSSEQRVELVRAAIAECPALQLDERELKREKASYTIDSLISLRAELGEEVSLAWAMGMDAFAGLNTWHRWRELLDYAHLVVVGRPGFEVPAAGELAELLRAKQGPERLLEEQSRGAIVLPSLSLLDISATSIRAQIARGESPQFLLPDSVWQKIATQGLYRPH